MNTATKEVADMENYRARFYPQAWQGDVSIDVDPEGETEWTPSDLPDSLRAAADEANGEEVVDYRDQLRGDLAAPTWIHEWSGPFTICVRREKED
jgi:hypothetical protein